MTTKTLSEAGVTRIVMPSENDNKIAKLERENAELRKVLKQIVEGAKRDSPMPSLEWCTLWKHAEALVAGNKGGKGK